MTIRPRLLAILVPIAVLAAFPWPRGDDPTWWRGNLHTHSLWSDGGVFPEQAAAIYKELGYHFVAFTDHDNLMFDEAFPPFDAYLAEMIEGGVVPGAFAAGFFPMGHDGKVWVNTTQRGYGAGLLEGHREEFGRDWVETTELDSETLVRLSPLDAFRERFEEPGRFMLLAGAEVTGISNVHLLGINLSERAAPFVPTGEETAPDLIRGKLDNIREVAGNQAEPVMAILAHPNYGGAVTAEHMAEVDGLRFFEVYNGHRGTLNFGDEHRKDTERIWDIVLAQRLSRGDSPQGDAPLLYGIATDDAHEYERGAHSSPARGWVMVRADALTPERIINAMLDGDFYATSGVELEDIRRDEGSLAVRVAAEPGVNYTIRFIGTREGVDLSSEPVLNADGVPLVEEKVYGRDLAHNRDILEHDTYAVTRRYGDEVGEVLLEVDGPEAVYRFEGDELYVRAKVMSDKAHENPFVRPDLGEEFETAWIQPVRPGGPR